MTQSTTMIMIDIESLALGPDAVVTQAAFMAVPKDDPSERINYHTMFLPIQPQLDAGRRISASTLIWWLQQDDAARAKFKDNDSEEVETLVAFVRAFIRRINNLIIESDDNYEIWAKGPQFDIVALESLFAMCGESAPWKYDKVRDLRTLMKLAGVSTDDVKSDDIVKHVALEDCRFQIRCYEYAMEQLFKV